MSNKALLKGSVWLLVSVGGVVGSVGIIKLRDNILCSRLADNERSAIQALRSIAAAEVRLRAQDLDVDGLVEYWVGDVASLYSLEGSNGPLRLISCEIAAADVCPLRRSGKVVPYKGYLFKALQKVVDERGVEENLRSERMWNEKAFGFQAYPETFGVTGFYSFFVNQSGAVIKCNTGGVPLMAKVWPHECRLGLGGNSCSDPCAHRSRQESLMKEVENSSR
jgi:hypothetical protein